MNLPITKTIKPASQGSVHLDTLRGASALLVFVNHTRALYFSSVLAPPPPTPAPLRSQTEQPAAAAGPLGQNGQIKLAAEAVVIFFVLSGYLVGGSVLRSLRSSRWEWKDYLAKRLTRLYVVLLPAVFLGVLLDRLGLSRFGPGSVYTAPPGLDMTPTAHLAQRLVSSVIAGNLFFLQGILSPIVGSNAALWSLSNEFWYYIAFPLAAIAIFPRFSLAKRLCSAVAAAAILVFVGWQIVLLFPIWIFGAIVSILPQSLALSRAKLLSALSALLLLAGMAAVRLLPVPALAAVYILGILCALTLYPLIQQKQPAGRSIYRAVAGFFSRISYSLYLFHLPLAVFLCAILDSPWHRWAKTPRNLTAFLASDLLILIVVYLLWWLFEANTDRIRLRLFNR